MKHHSNLFPVTLSAVWHNTVNTLHGAVSEGLHDWLFATGSLTARLKKHCSDFRVEVLGQKVVLCSEHEANDDIAAGEQVLVREVLLYCDDKPQVFARSLLPLKSLTGEEQSLAKLGDQPLGQVLFNHPDLVRKGIEVACFEQPSSLFSLIEQLELPQTPVWGRRSIFVLNHKPIMVTEVFLPESFAYELVSGAETYSKSL